MGSNLNTSHVLIYQENDTGRKTATGFKYISCSYLSITSPLTTSSSLDLNTSHVLIYQEEQTPEEPAEEDLNTSHVLIYRRSL